MKSKEAQVRAGRKREEREPSGEFPADGEEGVVAVGGGVCNHAAGHAGVEHVRATDEAARGRPVFLFSPATGGARTSGTGVAYLPLIQEPVVVAKAATPATDFFRGSETVLVVEDADALRKLSVTLLEKHGYQVLSAANGTAALELAQQNNRSIDLLLTDVIMPGLGGHALARRMEALRPGRKVLYMSAIRIAPSCSTGPGGRHLFFA